MFKLVPSEPITSVPGFQAGAVQAGIKTKNKLDLAILHSEVPCAVAGVFTTNRIKAAPVVLSQKHLSSGRAQAIVVNSGCANACVGEQGLADALEMARLTAAKLDIAVGDVLVASTGVIGTPLPMDRVRAGIKQIELDPGGGHYLVEAMMTTDTRPKEVAARLDVDGVKLTIAGVAKGAGMIHPDLATMLSFVATDALVGVDFLQSALNKAVDASFNMVSIDGETSPSDCVFLLANGLAGNVPIGFDNGEAFQQALTGVCTYLAKCIAEDGEGATKLIEVRIEGARNESEARQAARTIASSPLVKAAIHGSDPNWGRIVSALGRSGTELTENKLDVHLNDICAMKEGHPTSSSNEKLRMSLSSSDKVLIKVCLNLGAGQATAWGCDLSEEYVTINSEYTT